MSKNEDQYKKWGIENGRPSKIAVQSSACAERGYNQVTRTRPKNISGGTKIIPKLDSSISLFLLDSASEILFLGDAGDTAASRPSRRYGIKWTNHYRPLSWLSFEADIAATHARFRGDYPDLQYNIEQSLRPDHLYLRFRAPGD
jgi:hypothetical protein